MTLEKLIQGLDASSSNGDLESVTKKLDERTRASGVVPPPLYKIPHPREEVNLKCEYCKQVWIYNDNHWDGSNLVQPITGVTTFFASRGQTQWYSRWYLENNPPNSNCPVCVAASASSTA
jgi:hypothetical protein